jgi:hypothetical protein
MRRWRFFGRIGHQIAAVQFEFFQNTAQQVGTTRSFGAQLGQRIAEFGLSVFLEGESGFQFHDAALERITLGIVRKVSVC